MKKTIVLLYRGHLQLVYYAIDTWQRTAKKSISKIASHFFLCSLILYDAKHLHYLKLSNVDNLPNKSKLENLVYSLLSLHRSPNSRKLQDCWRNGIEPDELV